MQNGWKGVDFNFINFRIKNCRFLCLDVSLFSAMFGNCFDCPDRLTLELLLRLYLPSCSIFSNRTSRLAGGD